MQKAGQPALARTVAGTRKKMYNEWTGVRKLDESREATMWRAVTDKIFLSENVPSDKAAYLEHLKDKEIYDGTLRIPYPYRESDFDAWLQWNAEEKKRTGMALHWAIRDEAGHAMGGIGFHDVTPGESHKGEIGYWLAKPFWGKGIMTAAVKRVCEIGVNELELVRITACVFASNARSAKVLERAGFALEGKMRHYYLKDGNLIDGLLYAYVVDP